MFATGTRSAPAALLRRRRALGDGHWNARIAIAQRSGQGTEAMVALQTAIAATRTRAAEAARVETYR